MPFMLSRAFWIKVLTSGIDFAESMMASFFADESLAFYAISAAILQKKLNAFLFQYGRLVLEILILLSPISGSISINKVKSGASDDKIIKPFDHFEIPVAYPHLDI